MRISLVLCVVASSALLGRAYAETWSEWLHIKSDVPVPVQGAGWQPPPEALASGVEDPPVPVLLDLDHPIRDGRVLVARGGAIEAWDLETRKPTWSRPSESGSFGWLLEGTSVAAVLPNGPAARAGVRPGDEVVAVDGEEVDYDLPPSRAGDSHELVLQTTGGTRSLTLVAERAPGPYGESPELAAITGGLLLVKRGDWVECIALDDGRLVWALRGEFRGEAGGRVALTSETADVLCVDLGTGAVRWTSPAGPDARVIETVWANDTVLAARSDAGGTRIEALDASDGRARWSCVWSARSRFQALERLSISPVHGNRLLLAAWDPECCQWNMDGGMSLCEGPNCVTYWLFDLASGDRLWSERAGGRRHGGSHRMVLPELIPFDPLAGGPAAVIADRLFWFDLAAEDLSILDPETLAVERRIHLPGARLYSGPSPDGCVAIATKDGTSWVELATGEVSSLPVVTERAENLRFAGQRLLVPADSNHGPASLEAWDLRGGSAAWKEGLPNGFVSQSAVEGDRCLVSLDMKMQETLWIGLFDVPSGAQLWSVQLDAPIFWVTHGSGQGYTDVALVDPYLFISLSDGLHVYRRDDADRPR